MAIAEPGSTSWTSGIFSVSQKALEVKGDGVLALVEQQALPHVIDSRLWILIRAFSNEGGESGNELGKKGVVLADTEYATQ